jgi:sec-independent protein translocase protein TatA
MGIFGNAFGWPHLIGLLAVVLILFGAPKLPGLAKSIGQSMRIFRGEMRSMKDESGKDVPVTVDDAKVDSTADSDTSSKPKP